MNTEITYLYRDADNYKQGNTVVVQGELTFEQIEPYLEEGCYFIAGQVGLEDLQWRWLEKGFGFPSDADHVFSELDDSCIEPTSDEPTLSLTADQLLDRFRATNGQWDVTACADQMGI
jgi:hypothetical protein